MGHPVPMARALWSGTLTFGLVTIPVKLYPAVQRKTVRFHQLDGENLARIQQRRVNSTTGERCPTSASSRATRSRPTATS